MAAQLPPLPSPRSRQTEPPRVGLGRLKKTRPVLFRRSCGRLSLSATASAGGWARAAPPSHSARAHHRQAQRSVRSCAAAGGRQEQRQWQQRQRGSSGRGAERGRACRGCTMRRRRSVSLSSSASDGWYPAHTTHRLSDYPPTPAHSDTPAFRSRAVCQLDTRATHLCGSCPTLGRSGGRARGGSPG